MSKRWLVSGVAEGISARNVVLPLVHASMCRSFLMANTEFIDDFERLTELAPVATAPIQHHVFVCTGKSCSAVDSAEVKAAFERELKSRGLQFGSEKKGRNPRGSVVLTECGSVGFCAIGTAVLVYPDGVWYAQVRASDVPEIVEQHLLNGRVVERLALLKVPVSSVGK
jgi:(2Fe-2S) ferredoxin